METARMADVPVDLFRSCKSSAWKGSSDAKKDDNFINAEGQGSLFPNYAGFTRRDGSIRAPDITTFTDREGTVWVRGVEDRDDRGQAFVSWKEGVSVSTEPGGFGYEGWFYFLVPKGTAIPESLDVKATPSRNDSGHYSIRCRNLMRRDAYEGALGNLTRGALAKAVELGKQSFRHS
jgi:hypothetical protein